MGRRRSRPDQQPDEQEYTVGGNIDVARKRRHASERWPHTGNGRMKKEVQSISGISYFLLEHMIAFDRWEEWWLWAVEEREFQRLRFYDIYVSTVY